MDMKETVIQGIKAALAAAVSAGDLPDGEYPDVLLEVPPQKEFGDFATNIAMQSARIAHKSPRMIADVLLKHLDAPWLEKAEVAGAGFINFFLKHDIIYDTLCHILEQGKQYGQAPLRAAGNTREVGNPPGKTGRIWWMSIITWLLNGSLPTTTAMIPFRRTGRRCSWESMHPMGIPGEMPWQRLPIWWGWNGMRGR